MSASIVLVSQDEDVRSSVRSIAGEATEVDLVGVLSTTAELVAALDDGEVDVVLVDDGLTEMPALDLVRNLGQSRPMLAVLVLSRDPDPFTLSAVIEAGARGMIALPLSLQDLQARVDNAASWSRTLRNHVTGQGGFAAGRGRVVAIAGAKGGVGTTTLSVLLAQQSVLPSRTLCLVDLDLRKGDVAYYCGVTPRRSIADLADVASEITGRSIREVVQDVPAGFAVLTAPVEAERAEDVTALVTRQVLNQLRMQFELILVDVGATLDDASATVLEMADDALLVVTADVVSLRSARRSLVAWERLAIRQPDDVRLVVNMVSRRREVQPDFAQRVVQIPLAGAVPEVFAELEPAVNTGTLATARPGVAARAVCAVGRSLGLREQLSPPEAAGLQVEVEPLTRTSGRRRRGRRVVGDNGQSMVELPVVVGLFVAVFLLCLQGVVFGVTQILAHHAAQEVAREASVRADPATVNAAAHHALPLSFGDGSSVSIDQGASTVAVRVHTPRVIPLPSPIDLDVVARAEFQPEPS
ncbi:AAA family ATPase [Angustibacter sp. McL0619]|uniref:AAA family ATPase n=1 Tax=Angustibacter sp. McL0619 TaxID=3415676 RepID=UPI003CFB18E8